MITFTYAAFALITLTAFLLGLMLGMYIVIFKLR